jgi:hypothetical protein
MKWSNKFLVLILLLIPAVAKAQERPATCSVLPLYIDSYKCIETSSGRRCGRLRSANLGSIGTFQTDGSEGQIIRSFKYEKGLVVTVGIDHIFDYSQFPKLFPYKIKLAITVSDKEEKEVFEFVNSSESSTLYRENWNLTVSKYIKSGKGMYIFTLDCKDNVRVK